MDKVKKIAKYTTNVLAILSMLVAGINAVDDITIPYAIQIVQIIAVIQGIIGTYLLGNKLNQTRRDDNVNNDDDKTTNES